MAVALSTVTEDINLSGGDIVLPQPASIASGDTRVHWLINVGGTGAPAVGTGMTDGGSDADGAADIRWVWKIAGGAEGSITHTTPGTESASAGYAVRVTGAHASTPINASTLNNFGVAASPATLATVTTTVDNCLIVYMLFGGSAVPSMSVPTLFDRFWLAGVELGACYTEVKTTAGATTARQVTWTGSQDLYYAVIAIAPAAVAITGTVAVTLAAHVSSASGSVGNDRTGTVAVTLTPHTAAAAGTVTNPAVSGSVAVTLTSFTSAASGLTALGFWPTTISANGRTIEDQHGNPWPVLGDANLVPHTVTTAEVEDYLDELVAHGFNCFWTKLVYGASGGIVYEDFNGNEPFTGTIFQTSLNDAYWDNWEVIFQAALDRGISIWVFPTWAGFDDTEGDRIAMEAASAGQMAAYGAAVGARFKAYPNLIWMNGGDKPSPSATTVARWGSVASGITGAGANQLWGLQGTRNVLQSTYISTNGMGAQPFDINTMYQDETDPTGDGASGWGEAIGPVVSYEFVYENESAIAFHRLRLQYWGVFCAGGVGHVFGNRPRWHMDTIAAFGVSGVTLASTWDDPAGDDDRGTNDFAVFNTFIDSLAGSWSDMVPDTTDTFLTGGEGTGVTRSAARFDDTATTGVMAVIYRPNGGSATLTLDLTEFTGVGSVRIRKLDPVSGAYTTIGTFNTSAPQAVGSLGNNSSGDSDWVLVVEQTDDRTGTVAVTLGSFVSSASGTLGQNGTLARTLASFTSAASGTVTPPTRTGTVTVTLAAHTAAATGTVTGPGAIGGAADPTITSFVASAVGSFTPGAVTGTCAVTLAAFICAAYQTQLAPVITGPLKVRVGGPNRIVTPAGQQRTVIVIDGGRAPA